MVREIKAQWSPKWAARLSFPAWGWTAKQAVLQYKRGKGNGNYEDRAENQIGSDVSCEKSEFPHKSI